MQEENKRLKMALISGAAHAVRYREEKPHSSEQEIMQYISDLSDELIDKLDEEI